LPAARVQNPAAVRPRVKTQDHPPPRVAIENLQPRIDAGRFPAKRVLAESVTVAADIFADGHDVISAVLRYRARDYGHPGRADAWREAPMAPLGNDRWQAEFTVDRLAVYEFTVQAWVDRFATWRDGLAKKVAAAQDVNVELQEGAMLVRAALDRIAPVSKRAPTRRRRATVASPGLEPPDGLTTAEDAALGSGADRQRLEDLANALERGSPAGRTRAALSEDLLALMQRYDDRPLSTTFDPPPQVLVERLRARTGAWYEMFPRSYSPEPGRSATFDEAALRLPGVAEMGFDVLYLPPIHPIGTTFRKGRNNSLEPAPDDPGSPWAIGSAEGGHDAIDPGLGTLEDFDRFVAVANRLGLEIALDLAYQTSPDHPYVRSHPEWFTRRPDGTIKYAENPPKRYQDIYPIDFDSPDWRALWDELKRVVLFWVEHGVKVFRVDNPHTKPFAFWEWMIAEVRRDHPDVVFLSEAFTRPKIMRHLAKLGFSQSYTYFTWRNTKAELTEYFTELTDTEVREYMRPNLFANTPDILHEYLQRGGPPAFRVRLLLAATLGASYGIYSGFEVCENRPARPGSEEYLNSEKYEYRYWDWNTPNNLRELIALVNTIRREHPALQQNQGLRFHPTDNDQILCYSRRTADRADGLVIVVNLDPNRMQHGWVSAPAGEWELDTVGGYRAQDLLSGETYRWRGDWNYVRLDPGLRPGHILQLGAR
jgi:starch synthase (maltosyl-transferring)